PRRRSRRCSRRRRGFRPPPVRLERLCETLGLDAVRRVEVVPGLEDFELEIGEDGSEPPGDLRVLVRVAQPAECEVDRAIEPAQRLAVEVVALERLHEGADPGGALRHPRRRVTDGWWWRRRPA